MGKTFRKEKTADGMRRKLNKDRGKKKMRRFNYEEFYFNPETDASKLDEDNNEKQEEIHPNEGLRDEGQSKPSNKDRN